MDLIKVTLEEHIKMLNQLGYEIYEDVEEIPNFAFVSIYKKDREIGTIAYEEKNMCYLFRDKRIVGNRDLSTINFNKIKRKNIRSVIHLKLHDYSLRFNGYNQLLSFNDNIELRDYISITDNETYKITKYYDKEEIESKSLIDGITDDEIIGELKKPRERSLIYKR